MIKVLMCKIKPSIDKENIKTQIAIVKTAKRSRLREGSKETEGK